MAKVTQVTVSAGRTFNHPFESYSNLKPHVAMVIAVDEGDDVEKVIRDGQAQVERIVEQHKQMMIGELTRLQRLSAAQQRAYDLEKQLKRVQGEYDALKTEMPEAFAALGDGSQTQMNFEDNP